MLHGNVHDLVPKGQGGDAGYGSLPEFLATQLFGSWDVVLRHDLSQGLRVFAGHGMKGFAVIGAELIDSSNAHRWISVFPARLRKKLFEDAHLVYRESGPEQAGSFNLHIEAQGVSPDRNP